MTLNPGIELMKTVTCTCISNWATPWENLFIPYANNKVADQPAHPGCLIRAFTVRYLDSVILLLAVPQISRLYLASVAEQAGLSLTWSCNSKDRFSQYRLFFVHVCSNINHYNDDSIISVKILKNGHLKNCCNYSKIRTVSFYYKVIGPKDVDGIANSVHLIRSGSILFAQTSLS